MAELNGFNAEEVEPNNAFDALPPGWYTAIITESEWKDTKDGNGRYIALTIEIAEGEFANRKVWDRLNLQNQNTKAVEIAERTLSAICHSVGVLRPRNTEELHFKKLDVKLAVSEYNGDKRNEVKGYRAVGSEGAASKGTSSKAASKSPKSEAPKSSTPPWKRAG